MCEPLSRWQARLRNGRQSPGNGDGSGWIRTFSWQCRAVPSDAVALSLIAACGFAVDMDLQGMVNWPRGAPSPVGAISGERAALRSGTGPKARPRSGAARRP